MFSVQRAKKNKDIKHLILPCITLFVCFIVIMHVVGATMIGHGNGLSEKTR